MFHASTPFPIPFNVWYELLRWTTLISIPKGRRRVRKKHGIEVPSGRDIGQLPPEAVSNLWQTMTSHPYSITPTIQMYNRLMPNLLYRRRYGEIQLRMGETLDVLKSEVRILRRKEAKHISLLKETNQSLVQSTARDLILTRFQVWRNRQYLKRWVRLLLRRGSISLRFNDDWTSRNVPNIVRDRLLFLPSTVKYKIPTGQVSFWSDTTQLKKWRSRMLQRRAQQQAKYSALWEETDDFSNEQKDSMHVRETVEMQAEASEGACIDLYVVDTASATFGERS